MTELVLPNGVDKLSLPQKLVAGGIVAGGLYLILPTLLAMMVNIWMVIILGAPLVFAAYNYQILWLAIKNLSWKMTRFLIGLDVLSYMDRYLEWVGQQKQILIDSCTNLRKELEGVKGQLETREASYTENINRADAADKVGNLVQRDIALSKASDDKAFIERLSPIKNDAEKQVEYMDELTDVFHTKHEQLAYTIQARRSEYNSLKAMSRGMRAASDVVGQAGSANALWKETNNQLIDQMNQFTASIQTYESVLKPAIEQGRFDKQLRQEQGLKLLEQFRSTNFQLKGK